MNMFLIQLIGAVGYFDLALSYYKKNKKEILYIQIFAYIFFTIHYYLLGAVTGTVCNLLCLLAIIIIYIFNKENKLENVRTLVIGIIPFMVLISFLSYQNIFSIFPIIASVISLFSFINCEENTIRFIGIISGVCWLVYAILYKSYVAIIFEILIVVSTIYAFIKNKYLVKN